jgi:Ion channel
MLIVLVLLFVATPFLEGIHDGELIEAVLMSLFFLSAVLAVGGRRRTLLLTIVLALPSLAGKWLNHLQPHTFSPVIFLACAAIFLVYIIVQILRFVLRTKHVNAEVLCASISVYLMFGMAWAMVYRLVACLNPTAFAYNATVMSNQSMTGFGSFYFSFVTLSTLGYGDITPATPIARMLVVMEAMTGTLYVAVLIARLVALYSTPVPADRPNPSDQESR